MTLQTIMASPQPCNKTSRFTLGDKVYCYNVGMQSPLVVEVTIKGLVNNDDGIYYTADKSLWIKEEFLFKNRKDAYKSLISQAESEMVSM